MSIRFLLQHCISPSSVRRPPIVLLNRVLLNSSFTSSSSSSKTGDTAPPSLSSSQLLTLATAKQVKGDIPEAIALANRALTKQRAEDDPHATADTSLFLGKLLQLDNRYRDAETSFTEAHSIHRSLPPSQRLPTTTRNEYAALSHIAHTQKKQNRFDDAEASYLRALQGLEDTVGWEDGITNHTNFELARLYRERGRDDEAKVALETMKAQLKIVFGEDDSRVVQINGELAEVSLLLGDRAAAIALLDEIVDKLRPNSPEARRAFFRMEELKEDEEMGIELVRGGVTVTQTSTGQK